MTLRKIRSSSADSIHRISPGLGRGLTHSETALVSRRKFIGRLETDFSWTGLVPVHLQLRPPQGGRCEELSEVADPLSFALPLFGRHYNGGGTASFGNGLRAFGRGEFNHFAESCLGLSHSPIRCAHEVFPSKRSL